MSTEAVMISDEQFLVEFENQTLDPAHFNHIGHMRLAWLYLESESLEEAIQLTCDGIKSYAESLGAKDKFHSTITVALVRIMASRKKQLKGGTWQQFLACNRDLVEDAAAVLSQHYSQARLNCEQARNSVLEPDRQPI